jgi:alkylated DNA repair dioxygenase AlkB
VKVQQLAPGLLLLKGVITPQEQSELAQEVLSIGAHPSAGFWQTIDRGGSELNSCPYRGRMYRALTNFPPLLPLLASRVLKQAVDADASIVDIEATHAIALYYKTLPQPPVEGYIPWHQDNGENDGLWQYPVISFSIGDTCEFLTCEKKPRGSLDNPTNLAHRIVLESGNALVFGGESRGIWHAIYRLIHNTAPSHLSFAGARLNFTCRHTPQLLGREHEFATVSAAKLKNLPPEENPFYRLKAIESKRT